MSSLSLQLFHRSGRPTTAEEYAAAMLHARLDELAPSIKHLSARLDEVVTAARGLEIVCRVSVTLARAFEGTPFVVEGRALHVRQAVDLVADAIEGEVRRVIARADLPKRRRVARSEGTELGPISAPTLSRRARTSRMIRVRPEREGAVEMEATHPGTEVSAHPPRGEHFHMTRHQSRATSARELSATRPSRKSTRKSANRSKRDSNLVRRAQRGVSSSKTRATVGH